MSDRKLYHYSDCAVHNAPALKPGPCDCGGYRMPDLYDAALEACAGIDARTRFAAVIHMDDEGDMTVWCSQDFTDDREEVARIMRLAVKTVTDGDEVE